MTTQNENSLSIITTVKDGRLYPSDAQKDIVSMFLRPREGKQVAVHFSPPRKVRSGSQNRYLWGLVYSMIATETGHSPEDVHEYCKQCFLPRQFLTIGGIEVETPKSTTELTTMEFETYLERVRAFAAQELRMTIPLPGEN